MDVLIGCETSGTVRDVFRTLGHNAVSCDILPAKRPGPHLQMDLRKAMRMRRWDLLIAHPPCTYLTVCARRWLYHPDDRHLPVEKKRPHPNFPTRRDDETAAVAFFMELATFDAIPRRALENPVGIMASRHRPPDQIVHPYHFGDDASKATGLHLYGLPPIPLPPRDQWYPPRMVWSPRHKKVLPRWGNQCDGGGPNMPPSADRWDKKSATYPGIAAAMGIAWGLD